MERKLFCGAAKRCITPTEDLMDQVCGMMNTPFGKILDDLYLRVIALGDGENRALLISFDLDRGIDAHVNLPLISQHTGIPVENILYIGIHAHSAPGDKRRTDFGKTKRMKPKDGPRPLPPADGPYSHYVREKLLEAVDEAIGTMQPARMGFGYGKSYINVNRNQSFYTYGEDGSLSYAHGLGFNPERTVDPTLFVMKFEDLSGKPIAFFVNYAVHCVVMIWNNLGDGKLGMSGDIAGNVSQYMEAEYPDAVAMWSSGAAGDLNPIMMNQSYYPDPVTGKSVLYPIPNVETPLMMLKLLSARHYADIRKTIHGIKKTEETFEMAFARDIAQAPRCTVTKDSNGRPIFTEDSQRTPYQVPLHLLKLGDVALIAVSGEMYIDQGHEIQKASPMENTIVVNHQGRTDGINGGYVLDDATFYACMAATDGKTDDFTLKVDNFVPGVEGFSAMPGTVASALRATTEKLFQNA